MAAGGHAAAAGVAPGDELLATTARAQVCNAHTCVGRDGRCLKPAPAAAALPTPRLPSTPLLPHGLHCCRTACCPHCCTSSTAALPPTPILLPPLPPLPPLPLQGGGASVRGQLVLLPAGGQQFNTVAAAIRSNTCSQVGRATGVGPGFH